VKKWLIGIVAAVVVAGGGFYWALAVYPTRLFRGAVDGALASLPAGFSGSYGGATYSLLDGTGTLTGLAIHGPDANKLDLAIDTLTLVHPATDLGPAWAHAAADPTKIQPDLQLPVADAITVKGVSFRDADDRLTLASGRISHPRLYPWALLHPGVPSLAQARAALMEHAHAPTLADVMPLLRVEAHWMLGFGYDDYEAEGLMALTALPASGATPAASAAYTIQKMTSGRYDRGNTASSALEGLTMKSDLFGSFGIAAAKIEGLELEKPLTAFLANQDATPDMLDGLSLKSLTYGPMSVQGEVGSPSVIGTFALANVVFEHGLLTSADLAFTGLRVNREQLPNLNAVAAFEQLGLDAMTLNLNLGYRWDLAQGRMTVENATFEVQELGALSLSFEVEGAGSPQDLLAKARLVHAVLRYKDASLADRALKIAATEKGTDPDDLRQQLIATAQQMVTAQGATAATAATARAVSDFLSAPRSLAIELAPKQPVPLMALLAAGSLPPDRLVATFGLSIAANR